MKLTLIILMLFAVLNAHAKPRSDEGKEVQYPSVKDGKVFISPGESFSVGFKMLGDGTEQIYFDKEKVSKSRLDFSLKEELNKDGNATTRLAVVSYHPSELSYKVIWEGRWVGGSMFRSDPHSESSLTTSMDFPYPIARLILTDFRIIRKKQESNQTIEPRR